MPDLPGLPRRIDQFDFEVREQGLLEILAKVNDELADLTLSLVTFLTDLPWTD